MTRDLQWTVGVALLKKGGAPIKSKIRYGTVTFGKALHTGRIVLGYHPLDEGLDVVGTWGFGPRMIMSFGGGGGRRSSCDFLWVNQGRRAVPGAGASRCIGFDGRVVVRGLARLHRVWERN